MTTKLNPFESFFLAVMMDGQTNYSGIFTTMGYIHGAPVPRDRFLAAIDRMLALGYVSRSISKKGPGNKPIEMEDLEEHLGTLHAKALEEHEDKVKEIRARAVQKGKTPKPPPPPSPIDPWSCIYIRLTLAGRHRIELG